MSSNTPNESINTKLTKTIDNLAEEDGNSSVHSLPVTLHMKQHTPCILKAEISKSKDSPKISTADLTPEYSVQEAHSRDTSSHSALENNACNSSTKTRNTPLLHNFSVEEFVDSPNTLNESPAKSPGPSTFPLSQKKLRSIFRTAIFTNSLSNERNWKYIHQGPEHLKETPFPLIGSAVSVPQFWFNLFKGKHLPPVIFEAIKLTITDSEVESQPDEVRPERFVFRIELEYGLCKWVIYRKMYDIIKLHSLLKTHAFQGKLPKIPKLPSQWAYAIQKVTNPNTDTMIKLALERRVAIQGYLRKVLIKLNMYHCSELCEFLEISGSSIKGRMGWKGREGFMEMKTTKP